MVAAEDYPSMARVTRLEDYIPLYLMCATCMLFQSKAVQVRHLGEEGGTRLEDYVHGYVINVCYLCSVSEGSCQKEVPGRRRGIVAAEECQSTAWVI